MKTISFIIILVLSLLNTSHVWAKGEKDCDNRFVTLVNPVRSRDLWTDKSLNPLKEQYSLIKRHGFSATWLMQYDVLTDQELLDEINEFDSNQEKGVFLEISPILAEQARVIYPYDAAWFDPNAVFLSGYTQSERRKLIDEFFEKFKSVFGYYPKSVGAWWIDSYSLNYMRNKYDIAAALIVADQKITDNYGVWGAWWGMPYYPSKANILTPTSSLLNKQDVLIIQWAQRDPDLAVGKGPAYSNYSLQANDYIRQGKDTDYFKNLVNIYLDCKNPIGQVTVGLETGIESVGYIDEYGNQLKYLSSIPNLNFATMRQFTDKFYKVFPEFPKQFEVKSGSSKWIMTTDSRGNSQLGEYIKYQPEIAFNDFFIADKGNFLDRNLDKLSSKTELSYFPYFIIVIFLYGVLALFKKTFKLWVIATLFAFGSFGLILKSNYQFGWQVFYGFLIPYLIPAQIILILVSYIIIWLLSGSTILNKNRLTLWFIPLSFGLDFIIQAFRFSFIFGKYYFGVALDPLRFFGFSFTTPFNVEIVSRNFSPAVSSALLRFDFNKIWDNLYLSLIVYPLLHILLGLGGGYLIAKLPTKFSRILIGALIILTGMQLLNVFQADPRLVQ